MEIARFLQVKWGLGLGGGALICNPVAEADEIPAAEMAGPIDAAVAEAAQLGVTGKAVTPHVLARIVELTHGRSLRTNIALVQSNARLAAEIAVALSRAMSRRQMQPGVRLPLGVNGNGRAAGWLAAPQLFPELPWAS